MSSIEKVSKIDRNLLEEDHYFESLLAEAGRLGLLTTQALEHIQLDCLALLAKRTQRYNGGDSSSIPIEKAQDILTGILFTLGMQLKSYPSPDDAVAALGQVGIEPLYQLGRKRIDKLVTHTKLLHRALIPKLTETENEFYRSTAIDGIRGFFKLYSPDFSPQEIHITADYPVYNKTKRLAGIEFMKQYVEQLYYEALFCANFDAQDIHHLLLGYDLRYESLLFNLYEPVLAAALGAVLADTNVHRLEITPATQNYLHSMFFQKSQTELEQLLSNALSQLSLKFSFSDGLQQYVNQSLPLLAANIQTAIQANLFHQIFPIKYDADDRPVLTVSYGEKMDNALYRKVLEEFDSCESMADKLSVIGQHIHSLADLNDLLLDAMLSAQEMGAILSNLTLPEVAALMKQYSTQQEMSFTELREPEKLLCKCLQEFTAALPLQQQVLLQQAIAHMELQ